MSNLTSAYIMRRNAINRKENDYYPTPPLATKYLVKKFGHVMPKNIWEPAAGRGWISRTLQDDGFNIHSSDLYSYEAPLVDIDTGQDFLTCKAPKDYKGIVTNPPYKDKMPQKLLERSLEEFEFTAFFLRLTFMESAGRYELFKDNPPSVLVFSPRMNCQEEKFGTYEGQMGGMVAYAWYVWSDKLPGGTVQWCNPKEMLNDKR